MKYAKIILWAALTLAASAAFAQTEANRNRLAEIEKMEVKAKKGGPKFDRFGIRLVPEIGYGAHLVKSEDFRSQGMDSGQAYLVLAGPGRVLPSVRVGKRARRRGNRHGLVQDPGHALHPG